VDFSTLVDFFFKIQNPLSTKVGYLLYIFSMLCDVIQYYDNGKSMHDNEWLENVRGP